MKASKQDCYWYSESREVLYFMHGILNLTIYSLMSTISSKFYEFCSRSYLCCWYTLLSFVSILLVLGFSGINSWGFVSAKLLKMMADFQSTLFFIIFGIIDYYLTGKMSTLVVSYKSYDSQELILISLPSDSS